MNSYLFKAVLSNPHHPEYGVSTIPFPIPGDDYGGALELLSALEIGDAVEQDCRVNTLDSHYSILKRLEGQSVNVDELDYLAKRLDSFCTGEDAQFQAMADKLALTDVKDLINLTFCCQQATVISDFSRLEQVGKDHLMNLNGGSISAEEYQAADGKTTALALIRSGEGQITPYGVVYDNGMKLEQLYKGREFPGYLHDRPEIALAVTPKSAPADAAPTFLFLPSSQLQIDRALQRGGIHDPGAAHMEVDCEFLPAEVSKLLNLESEPVQGLNEMCRVISRLTESDRQKLNAVILLAEPQGAAQIQRLAENIELFDYALDVKTPEELGEYMVKESGHFEYDPNLEGFYDYGKLGRQRIAEHTGQFTDHGYISYEGTQPLQEWMEGPQDSPGFQMGGLQA